MSIHLHNHRNSQHAPGRFVPPPIEAEAHDPSDALFSALWRGDEIAAVVVLEHGADPNARHLWGYTPLMAAAESGNPALVKLLLRHGADRKSKDVFDESAATLASHRLGTRGAAIDAIRKALRA